MCYCPTVLPLFTLINAHDNIKDCGCAPFASVAISLFTGLGIVNKLSHIIAHRCNSYFMKSMDAVCMLKFQFMYASSS